MTANNEDVKSREKVFAYRELKLRGADARGCGAHIHRAAEKASVLRNRASGIRSSQKLKRHEGIKRGPGP
jgi:hypothetical protein